MAKHENPVALVTGASRGLGKGIALALGRAGMDIALNYHRSGDEAEAVADALRAMGRQAELVKGDVSDAEAVARMFGALDDRFGRLDVLVNNAGTTRAETIDQTTLESWDRVIRTNLTSCFLCSQQAMSRMERARAGRIINIGSVVAEAGSVGGHVHYSASKSGMLGLTKTLARQGAQVGITVNCVAPGIIDTDLLHQTHGPDGVARLTQMAPLGLGTPEDVGAAVAFLAGPGGRYITGATIDVNGGLYLR